MHTFMCDAERKVRLTAICHCLQETAGLHAVEYQLGYEGMKANNQAWVLNRLRVEVNRYLDWKDTLKVETWVQMMRGPFSQRFFLLKDEKDEVIGSANTFWVVIDSVTHKPKRLKSTQDVPIIDTIPPCGVAEKIALPDDLELIDNHKVRHSDLDLLQHVNNTKYIEWILDTQLTDRPPRPQRIELNFTGEARLGDTINILVSTSSHPQFYQLKNAENDKEICKVQI